MQFSYTVGESGWADAVIEAHGSSALLVASYLTDALGDLLAAVLAMLDGAERASLVWEEEPGLYSWTFERAGDVVLLRIMGTDIRDHAGDDPDDFLPDGLVFETREPMTDIAAAIAVAADRVDRDLGQWKYGKSWLMPFPGVTLWKIHHRLANPEE